jgi:hypothetical protein
MDNFFSYWERRGEKQAVTPIRPSRLAGVKLMQGSGLMSVVLMQVHPYNHDLVAMACRPGKEAGE